MKKLSSVATGFLLVLATATAIAAPVWSSNAVTISQIQVDSSTVSYLLFPVAPNNKPACGGTQAYGELNVASADTQKALMSIATAALLAGRPVNVRWTGNCIGAYATLDAIAIN